MTTFVHLPDAVKWVSFQPENKEKYPNGVLLIDCKYCAGYNGREVKNCKDPGPCCMGDKKECSHSCQCPNNKQGDVNNG